ncbi:hypothetical protein [Actinoplanes sp. NPDC049599]|uniref:hypothetical protein n=1 Tax=Actinoplanes sp. NPDC049599 TaxID=3363903 RepID=UPI0037941539
MIVFSLLLILVAVTLLVLGLVGGSSFLLISSIVTSLLAAVALVIGARQASAARRAATLPGAADAGPGPMRRPANADDSYPEREPALRDAPLAGEEEYAEPDGYAAGRRDTEEYLTGPDATQRVQPDADLYDDAAAGRTSSGQAAGPASPESAAEADYDQAATVIGEARADDQSWRREPVPAESAPVTGPADAAAAGAGEEFDEPDPDDPDDEPLPQSVRPADAVRVARLDAEVLVVDGRPRYHLADCSHLMGRVTEGLPVAEAVELGFSPCGLCRPVDRLVAAAARH